MATITVRVEVEEALIKAQVPRKEWADYANKATLEKLNIRLLSGYRRT